MPIKMFCLDTKLKNSQLVRYVSDLGMKWFALTGLIADVSFFFFYSLM